MVLFPDPLRPVNQRVAPFCFKRPARSSRVAWPSCQVMLVARTSVMRRNLQAIALGSNNLSTCLDPFHPEDALRAPAERLTVVSGLIPRAFAVALARSWPRERLRNRLLSFPKGHVRCCCAQTTETTPAARIGSIGRC